MDRSLFLLFIAIVFLSGCDNTSNKTSAHKNKEKLSKEETINSIPLKPHVIESSPTDEERKLYQEGHDLWYNGDTEKGISVLRKFINKYPESSLADDAQSLIGTAYTNLDKYDKAISEYKEVKIKYPDSDNAAISLYNIAHTYFYEKNDFEKAKYYYQQFINEATEDDKKWRDIAIEQLENWDENTKRFEGYAERKKERELEAELYEQKDNPTKYLKITNHSWNKGGFGTVGLHDLTIKNTSKISYKDLVIKVEYFAESETLVGRNIRTIYKIIEPNTNLKITELNTGFIPADAHSSTVIIITALPVK
ncbi:tetratricopeptide repeat protein [bacterium]|nr:tetratricopeptide repeat protein [bacterium]MBU1615020.1 tetratricopeptide repeat protein [bacterium]